MLPFRVHSISPERDCSFIRVVILRWNHTTFNKAYIIFFYLNIWKQNNFLFHSIQLHKKWYANIPENNKLSSSLPWFWSTLGSFRKMIGQPYFLKTVNSLHPRAMYTLRLACYRMTQWHNSTIRFLFHSFITSSIRDVCNDDDDNVM